MPGLYSQAADMHMAPNHTGSLAGFKSLGDMRFYALCCFTPEPSSVPMHTQRQDPWHTCSSRFSSAGQKSPPMSHLFWPSLLRTFLPKGLVIACHLQLKQLHLQALLSLP